MCGIAGIISQKRQQVNISDIKKMCDVISHRGPDASEYYSYKNLSLGHRRLSILDLSLDGNQPMHFEDKYTIIFNGEIYNYIEIRAELVNYNYQFDTNSDTEVILCAYDHWGRDCVSRFNGMWSFAILDKVKDEVFFSRDRFGVKPFYYTIFDSQFIFCSEIKQILEITNYRKVNYPILSDYLVMGFLDHTNETFFDSIYKLEPSHNLVYNLLNNEIGKSQYYDLLEIDYSKLSDSEIKEKFNQTLNDAVSLRLRSDVKVGTCLSGGLDSSSIAAIASKLSEKLNSNKFFAIHAKSTEKMTDESGYALQVSDHCNLDLSVIEPTLEQFVHKIDEVVYTQEEPFGGLSIFMQYFVMQESKRNSCVVLLDGQGGDECLLGYERYYPAIFYKQNGIKGILEFYKSIKNSKISFLTMIGFCLYFPYFRLRKLILVKRVRFLKKKFISMANFKFLELNSRNYFNLFKLQKQEIYSTQLQALLRYEDRNSMRHSIEARLPFLDYRLLQLSLSINERFKIREGWTKHILRQCVELLLPNSVVWRRNKKGFEAPTGEWGKFIDQSLSEEVSSSRILNELLVPDVNLTNLDHLQKWRLYNIAKWEKIFKVEF